MEPEVSLPCHKSPTLVPVFTKMNQFHINPSHSFNIHFNIIPEPTIRFSLWPLSFDFFIRKLSLMRRAHLFGIDHADHIRGTVQIMVLLLCSFLQPSLTSFLFRINTYFPRHRIGILQCLQVQYNSRSSIDMGRLRERWHVNRRGF